MTTSLALKIISITYSKIKSRVINITAASTQKENQYDKYNFCTSSLGDVYKVNAIECI